MGMNVSAKDIAKYEAMARERGGVVGPTAAIATQATAPTLRVFKDEADFQAAIVQQAKLWGWLAYHTHDSRRCEPGFVDLVMLRRDRLLAWELKRSRREKPTPAQRKWLRAFQSIPGAEVRIYSPEDWGTIIRELS